MRGGIKEPEEDSYRESVFFSFGEGILGMLLTLSRSPRAGVRREPRGLSLFPPPSSPPSSSYFLATGVAPGSGKEETQSAGPRHRKGKRRM